MAWPWAVLALLVLLALVVLFQYNRMVTLRNRVRESWSNVDTELLRRHELVPNLVAAVRGYARHEHDVLERVTQARAAAAAERRPGEALTALEGRLGRAIGQLLAVAESYPRLQASASFLALQRELANTEDRIQAARRFYNGNVRDYLDQTRQFPGVLVARAFRFAPEPFFQLDAASSRAAPSAHVGHPAALLLPMPALGAGLGAPAAPALAQVVGILLLGGLAVAAIVVATILHQRHLQRRRAQFRQVAAGLGAWYEEADTLGRAERYAGFTPFGRGEHRTVSDIVTVDHPMGRMEVFAYRYTVTTGAGKNRHSTTYHHVVATAATRVAGPGLTIAREGLGHKLFDALGGSDIDLESDEFSRRYWVQCRDRKFAYDVLDARMMQWFLDTRDEAQWQWRGTTLMAVTQGRLQPGMVVPAIQRLDGFLRNVPRHVHERAAGGPPESLPAGRGAA